ncbi:MAG: DUF374 domain-containing protein [Gammaproteobacteria bacterium]|nr:DUF374 domain-containing protein [Gammaproteobacteria bacterium]MBP9729481.1 DUF374 domain-containing protein [Gammaproteobacteria bacterium]
MIKDLNNQENPPLTRRATKLVEQSCNGEGRFSAQGNVKRYCLGFAAYMLSSLLHKSLQVRTEYDSDYDPTKPYLFAFWHGKQLLPVLHLVQHQTRRIVLVSPSKDGDILAFWLKRLNYVIIRGSSRDQNTRALHLMRTQLRQGCSLGFGVDGPIGPIYSVKPGMTYLAQKFQIPIIPVGTAFVRPWVLEKAWDRYEIPKPFSKAAFYLGKPLLITKGADLMESNHLLEVAIVAAEARAQALLALQS